MKCQGLTLKLNKDKSLLCYTLNDFYRAYKKARKGEKILSQVQYRKALIRVFEKVSQEIITTATPFNPRVALGRFGIVKRRNNNTRKINFPATRKYNKIIYFDNRHSDGFYFRFFWEKNTTKCRFTNKRFYTFKAVPKLSNKLHKHIMKLNDDPYTQNYNCLTSLPPYEQT